ncbi:YbaK/EbsC family protein [Kineococcus sp. NUM-3379]
MGIASRGGSASPELLEQPAVAALATALESMRAAGTVHVLPQELRTPAEVAAHLGVPTAALAVCVLLIPPGPGPAASRTAWLPWFLRHERAAGGCHPAGTVLVVTSCVHRVVPEQVADVLGLPALREAEAVPVLQDTGSVLGGVAPLGHPEPLTTLVDVALAPHPVVWARAGHPRTVFPTRYDELLRLTGGQPVEVG